MSSYKLLNHSQLPHFYIACVSPLIRKFPQPMYVAIGKLGSFLKMSERMNTIFCCVLSVNGKLIAISKESNSFETKYIPQGELCCCSGQLCGVVCCHCCPSPSRVSSADQDPYWRGPGLSGHTSKMHEETGKLSINQTINFWYLIRCIIIYNRQASN